jgi:peptidoglycan hydrolase-like protein with peptidoglycan-binding domain
VAPLRFTFPDGRARVARRLLPMLLVAVFAAPAAAAASAQPVAPVPAVASSPRPAAILQLGSRGSSVRSLQATLARLSYLPAGAVDGVFGLRTWHALVAFQGWQGLLRDGVAGPQTLQALARARPPAPWSTAAGIEVHIPQQVMLLVANGRVQRAIHVSTGRPGWPTPAGRFEILSRQTMSWSAPFQTWMPLAQYFDSGYAMHEYPEVPAYPASHGCVRLPAQEAGVVWQFGRLGMRVWTSP